jgi:hypothetical protein
MISNGILNSSRAEKGGHHSTPLRPYMASKTYRAFTHKIGSTTSTKPALALYFNNIFNALQSFPFDRTLPTEQGTFTHKIDEAYRAFTHLFTVFSPIFSCAQPKTVRSLRLSTQQFTQFQSVPYSTATAFPPIKPPYFHTCTYRTFTQGDTVLSHRYLTNTTVLSPMIMAINLLNTFTNSILKVDLKPVYKKIISLVDVLSFEFRRKRY